MSASKTLKRSGLAPCHPKTHAELAAEWDRLAEERHREIVSGEDLSFDKILAPTTLRLLEPADKTLTLDIGCGTGDFTLRLAQIAARVIGIEPSSASLAVARATCGEAKNVRFIH